MIAIEHEDDFINIAVAGEFTLADYKEFEELVRYKIKFRGKVDLLFDLRDMLGFTIDVAWEEIQFSRQHSHDFRRVAVVTTDQWVIWSAWLSRMFVDAEILVFEEYDAAKEWVTEPADVV